METFNARDFGDWSGKVKPTYLDTNFLASHSVSNVVIHLFAVFDDHLNVEALKAAHSQLYEQVPAIACDLVDGHWRPAQFDPGKQLGFINLGSKLAAGYADMFINNFVSYDPHPGKAPQLKSLLLRTGTRDLLILQAHHTALDGSGLKQALHQLSMNYTQLTCGSREQRPLVQCPREALTSIASSMTVNQVREAKRVTQRDQMRMVGAQCYQLPREATGRPGYLTLRVPQKLLRGLRANGPTQATTNDKLLATMATVLARSRGVQGGPVARFAFAIDLRRYLPDDQTVYGNLGSVATIQLRLALDDDIDTVLLRVLGETSFLKAHGIGLPQLHAHTSLRPATGAVLGALTTGYRTLMAFGLGSPVLTNLGKIERHACNFGGTFPTNVSFAPSIPRRGHGLIAGVSEFDDALTIHIAHSNGPRGVGLRREFAAAWCELLAHYAGARELPSPILRDSLLA